VLSLIYLTGRVLQNFQVKVETRRMTTSIAVLGAGPCGIAAAMTLLKRPHISICVLDKKKQPNDPSQQKQQRVGESVSGSIFSLLASIGLEKVLQKRDLYCTSSGNSSTWGNSDSLLSSTSAIHNPVGQVLHLNRSNFESALKASLQDELNGRRDSSSMIADAEVSKVTRTVSGKWKVSFSHPLQSSLQSIEADWVIDCLGINMGLRGRLCEVFGAQNHYVDSLVALSRHYPKQDNLLIDEFNHTLMTECVPFGWFYSSTLPAGDTVVSLMCDAPWLKKHTSLYHIKEWTECIKPYAPHTWRRLNHNTNRSSISSLMTEVDGASPSGSGKAYSMLSARSHVMSPLCGDGWISAGDAACSFDPISSMGIGHALLSGTTAAKVVAVSVAKPEQQSALLRTYTADVYRNYEIYLRQRRATYCGETRFQQEEFWNSRRNCSFTTSALTHF
jgi:2-polyprenyl-6-methoxyphenol hydroxylase-like FAD-dependent oxidoreductase